MLGGTKHPSISSLIEAVRGKNTVVSVNKPENLVIAFEADGDLHWVSIAALRNADCDKESLTLLLNQDGREKLAKMLQASKL